VPGWSEILSEMGKTPAPDGGPDCDSVRRKYLSQAVQHSGRPLILYATNWTQPGAVPDPYLVSINDEDIQGFMAVSQGLKGPSLDLMVHSPGGSAETVEAIVTYLRTRFQDIRVIVPQQAMSAATMLACAANLIVMGKHSFLGPIDPQFILATKLGGRAAPAQAILDQFDKAVKECQDPAKLLAWIPMLDQYGPDLIVCCETAIRLSRNLVRTWLRQYMFKDDNEEEAAKKATCIAKWLSSHRVFQSHSRHIGRSELEERGLKIERLERDPDAQDLFLSVFHATTHTFNLRGAAKIIENHRGGAFVKIMGSVVIRKEGQAAPQPEPPK